MPIYDLPTVPYYFDPGPEVFVRTLHEPLGVRSILDVGAGHGGVFDYGYWDGRDMDRREACDIHWIRPMSDRWTTKIGVDAQELTKHYEEKSFDYVQCTEVLEHVPDPTAALKEFIKVARKLVFITSADEMHHMGAEQEAVEKVNKHQKYILQPSVKDLVNLGFTVRVDNYNQRQLIAWKFL